MSPHFAEKTVLLDDLLADCPDYRTDPTKYGSLFDTEEAAVNFLLDGGGAGNGSLRSTLDAERAFTTGCYDCLGRHPAFLAAENRWQEEMDAIDRIIAGCPNARDDGGDGSAGSGTTEAGTLKCDLGPDAVAEVHTAVRGFAVSRLKELIDSCFESCLVWRRGDCEWDASGELETLDDPEEILAQLPTVRDVLETYTGDSIATYCSGCGLDYRVWAQEFEREVERALQAFVEERLGEEDDYDDDIIEWAAQLCEEAEGEVRGYFEQAREVAARKVLAQDTSENRREEAADPMTDGSLPQPVFRVIHP